METLVKCHKCGTLNAKPDSKFCEQCGAELISKDISLLASTESINMMDSDSGESAVINISQNTLDDKKFYEIAFGKGASAKFVLDKVNDGIAINLFYVNAESASTNYLAVLNGNGAIAQGQESSAIGSDGILLSGSSNTISHMPNNRLLILHSILTATFDLKSIKRLYSELNLSVIDENEKSLDEIAENLITEMDRQNRIPDLISASKKIRPDVEWNNALKSTFHYREFNMEPTITPNLKTEIQNPDIKTDEKATSANNWKKWLPLAIFGTKITTESLKGAIQRLVNAKPSDAKEIAISQIELLNNYYSLALEQARRSFGWALFWASVGMLSFIVSGIFLLTNQSRDFAVLGIISGTLVEMISGINFYLYGKTSSQLADFHTRLDATQKVLLANSICENIATDLQNQARFHIAMALVKSEAIPNIPSMTPQSDIHIAHVEYDPPGKDINQEHVRIKNSGLSAIDIHEWILQDNAGHQYFFPKIEFPGNSYLRIWTKSGNDTSTDLFWGNKSPIWNNTGDSVLLIHSNGVLVDKYSYGVAK